MSATVTSVQISTSQKSGQERQRERQMISELYRAYQELWLLPPHLWRPEDRERLGQMWQLTEQWPIAKQAVAQIELDQGGVREDTHWYRPRRTDTGYIQRRYCEVCLHEQEEVDRLNRAFDCNHPAGALGENITVAGLATQELTRGTVLRIGRSRLRVSGRRSFCFKYIRAFCTSALVTKQEFDLFDRARTGLALTVLTPGDVRAGDTIEIETVGAEPAYTKIPVFELWASPTSERPSCEL